MHRAIYSEQDNRMHYFRQAVDLGEIDNDFMFLLEFVFFFDEIKLEVNREEISWII
jgi:hypothetical protein